MRGKLVLLVGIGIGYVLGARAGRQRYEDIKRTVSGLWNDPRVQHQVRNVEEFAKDKAPDVVDFLGDTAKKVVQRKAPARKTATSKSQTANTQPRKPAASSTSTTAKKK